MLWWTDADRQAADRRRSDLNKVTPCNADLDELRVHAEHLDRAGVVAYQFDTIAGLSDGISMGAEAMRASLVSRDWIAEFG